MPSESEKPKFPKMDIKDDFLSAIKSRDVRSFYNLVDKTEEGKLPESKSGMDTPLTAAIKGGNLAAAIELLARGATYLEKDLVFTDDLAGRAIKRRIIQAKQNLSEFQSFAKKFREDLEKTISDVESVEKTRAANLSSSIREALSPEALTGSSISPRSISSSPSPTAMPSVSTSGKPPLHPNSPPALSPNKKGIGFGKPPRSPSSGHGR